MSLCVYDASISMGQVSQNRLCVLISIDITRLYSENDSVLCSFISASLPAINITGVYHFDQYAR